ncbi:MAG: FlgD immunoglobulin-like domain containing protein, partial [Candidatus Eisenbacteria bacterium]
ADANTCSVALACSLRVLGVPAAITDLAVTPTTVAGSAAGTFRLQLTFGTPAFATSFEVYRAPFGGYPAYDDAGGQAPATPAYPPVGPWVLTPVTASGQLDAPPSRDAWSYVVFTKNTLGQVSPVSNVTPLLLDYLPGDFANGSTPGTGDNAVGFADVSLLGAHYGISGAAVTSAGVGYLDIGPTIDRSPRARPATDGRIDFEDLIVLVTNFGALSSPAALTTAADAMASRATGDEQLALDAPASVRAGETFRVTLSLHGAGRVQGLSVQLGWDPVMAEPVDMQASSWLTQQRGVAFSAAPGRIDAALLGVREQGFSGEGEVATVTFRALRTGAPLLRVAHAEARDAANRPLSAELLGLDHLDARPAQTLLFAPSPNPARGPALVSFALAQGGRADLAIYSVDGRRVRTLAAGELPAGQYHFTWNGETDDHGRASPGVYFAQLVTRGQRFSRKLITLQ